MGYIDQLSTMLKRISSPALRTKTRITWLRIHSVMCMPRVAFDAEYYVESNTKSIGL